MIFPKGIFIKTLFSATAIVGGYAGIYYTSDFYFNIKTSYDRALIDFLENGGNINFKITHKSGDSGSETNLNGDFPSFTEPKKTITVAVKVSTADNDNTGTITEAGEKATKKNLKEANGGNDWNWNCKITFDKGENTETELETVTKEKIFKSQNEGILGILKGGNDSKKKIDFIKKCAKHRGWSKNKELNIGQKTADKEISGEPVKIELVGKDSKLIFKNQSDMEYWISRA